VRLGFRRGRFASLSVLSVHGDAQIPLYRPGRHFTLSALLSGPAEAAISSNTRPPVFGIGGGFLKVWGAARDRGQQESTRL